MTTARRRLAVALLCGSAACVEGVSVPPPAPADELAVGESRTVVLRFLRLDVEGVQRSLTLEDLRALPRRVLEETWLLDLDMKPLVRNVVRQLVLMPPEEGYALPQAPRNLWELLNMTPASANLSGTALEDLFGVGQAVGISPSTLLADLVQIDKGERLVPTEITAEAIITNVMSTHPNTRFRRGPVTSEHPDGLYPVAAHSLPISLADLVSNFEDLAEHFGPAKGHPGFIKAASAVISPEGNFRMTVKVNGNVLPWKGVDAGNATVASVNSTASQIKTFFDFDDPSWLTLAGLPPELRINDLTMLIRENEEFLPSGTSREPLPLGNSPVWTTPPWQFEHVLASVGVLEAQQIEAHCTSYGLRGEVKDPFRAVQVCIDETGWTTIEVDPAVVLQEPPPSPSYFWDILLEVAQARLHDGGLAEGEADLELTVRDVPIGLSTEDLVAQVRRNFEQSPEALTEMAEQLTANTFGDADFFYYQPRGGGDYLYFITPEDIRTNEEADPVRPYAYENQGFFADAELHQKISSKEVIDGDADHEKVKIDPGTTLFMEDDARRRYEVHVGGKPSRHRVSLTLTRIQ